MFAESDMAIRAYQMRAAGASWWDIADRLQITQGHAARLVAHKIAAAAQLVDEGAKRQLLAMEIERLDSLQQSLWDRALGGDIRAVDSIVRIITTRSKILGLETATANTVTNNTIVVAGNTEEYVAALQQATRREPVDGN